MPYWLDLSDVMNDSLLPVLQFSSVVFTLWGLALKASELTATAFTSSSSLCVLRWKTFHWEEGKQTKSFSSIRIKWRFVYVFLILFAKTVFWPKHQNKVCCQVCPLLTHCSLNLLQLQSIGKSVLYCHSSN